MRINNELHRQGQLTRSSSAPELHMLYEEPLHAVKEKQQRTRKKQEKQQKAIKNNKKQQKTTKIIKNSKKQ